MPEITLACTASPRGDVSLAKTLVSLRRAGATGSVHVFAEPGTPYVDDTPSPAWHGAEYRLGAFRNWLRALRWYVEETQAPYLLLFEDDAAFASGIWDEITAAVTRLHPFGLMSLYLPARDARKLQGVPPAGWFQHNSGWRQYGTVALLFDREGGVEDFVRDPGIVQAQPPPGEKVVPYDSLVYSWYQRRGTPVWFHYPSLVDHPPNTSTLGHVDHAGRRGWGFNG